MSVSTLTDLLDHLDRGGAATLNHPGRYPVPEGALIAPARYAGNSGSEFVFETRFLDGAFVRTALVDSKGSQANRAELGLVDARHQDGPARLIPTIAVAYADRTLLDLELPHRAVDAHVRASSENGEPTVKQGWYRALRDATAVDLSPVFTAAPAMLAFGGWDSSRKRGQLRLRSLLVSELFGVVGDDGDRAASVVSKRAGARLDPLGQDFALEPDELQRVLDRQRDEMSTKTVEKIEKEITAARKKGDTLQPSALGLGGVPPVVDRSAPAYGVAVPEVRRSRTYSLAGLRRLRFGGSREDDVAARAALLGTLLLGTAYADADPEIRAYCDVGAPRATVLLDDEPVDLDLSIDAAESFLGEAIDRLPERLAWTGQQHLLQGDPGLDRGALADTPEE